MDTPVGRCRMNMSQTAKGTWQIDVTAEYATVEETALNLGKALDAAQEVAKSRGIPLVSQ